MISDNVRKEITIALRQDGEGVAARAALEVEKLKETIERAGREFTNNAIQADEYRKAVRGASTDLGFWVRAQEQATKAMREIDEGFVEMQKHLQMYNERDARDAAENAILKNRIHDSTLAAMRQRADEESAIRNRLREMNERDAAQAVAAEQARVAALKEGTQAVVEHANAIREQSAADRERITVLNKLIPLVKLTADEVAKDQQKQVAAIADSIGSWTAWANVVSHAKDESVRFAERSSETVAAVKAANAALRETTITAKEANEDINKIANSQRVLASAWGDWVHNVDNAAEHTKRNAGVVKELEARYDAAGVSLDKVRGSAVNVGIAFNDANKPIELNSKAAREAAASYYEEAAAIKAASGDLFGLNNLLKDAAFHEQNQYKARGALIPLTDKSTGTNKEHAKSLDEQAKAAERAAYGTLHIAHAFQDLQYGIGAVLNNIPLVVQAFGGGAGLAGQLMIAGVSANVLYNNFDKVVGALSVGSSSAAEGVEHITAKVKALESQWFNTYEAAKEYFTLQKDVKHAEEADKIAAMPSESQEKNKAAFAKAVKEGGGGHAVESIVQDIEVNKFMQSPGQAVKAAIESGRIGPHEALGMSGDKAANQVATDDKMYEYFREVWFRSALPSIKNETMDRLAKGEIDVTKSFMGSVGAHPRLGALGDDGNFKNKFLNTFHDNLPEVLKQKEQQRLEDDYEEAKFDEGNQRAKERRLVREKSEEARRALVHESEKDADARINSIAGRFGGNFEKANKRRILEGIAAGKGNEAIAGEMTAGAVSSLGEAGVPKSIVNEVAKRILTKAIENVAGDTAAASLGGKGGIKAAAKDMISGIDEKESNKEEADINRAKAGLKRNERDAKEAKRQALINTLQNEFGATQGQAEEAAPKVEELLRRLPKGANPGFAYQAVFAKMSEYMNRQNMLMLEQQAAAEAMLGIMGQATQELATRRAVQGGINQRLRRLGGGVRPGLMPTFGFQG